MCARFEIRIDPSKLEKLREYKAMLKDIEREIERAERAGLDVEALKAKFKVAKEQLTKILEVYG